MRKTSAPRQLKLSPKLGIWLAAIATLAVPTLAVAAEATTPGAGWSRASNTDDGRQLFPAVTLSGGQVFLASGNSAELFDPADHTFSAAGTLTVDRGLGPSATLLRNGTVLLAGGGGFAGVLASAELYDPARGTLTPTGDMSAARSFHTATLLADGRVLVAGGSRSGFPEGSVSTADIYDPVSGTFSPAGEMTAARVNHTATLLGDGRVLVAGGYEAGLDRRGLATAEVYDPDTGTFAPTGSMAASRGSHTATALGNGTVLVTGGYPEFPGPSRSSAELYDPASGTFAPTGDMHEARGDHTATLLENETVLLSGGFTAFPFTGTTHESVEIYDQSTGSFTLTASMHDARGRHAAALLPNGDVLVAGGLGAQFGGAINTAEVYSLALVDTRPPRITTPGDVTVIATGPEGAVVPYTVTATDNVDDDPQQTCQPPSENTFPVGATTVTCTAADNSGNTATASFTVNVLMPLDIGLVLEPLANATRNTGVATVSGSVSCNRTPRLHLR
jgi:hypothetical protein